MCHRSCTNVAGTITNTMHTHPQLAPIPASMLGKNSLELVRHHELVAYRVPLRIRFRGVTTREGLLIRQNTKWAECAPFWDYSPKESSIWLKSALSVAGGQLPPMRREWVPVNLTVPVCSPEEVVHRIEVQPGCATAKVKVADPGSSLEEDAVRVALVAQLLHDRHGDGARVRVDANAAWDVDQAQVALNRLNEAAGVVGGLEYAEQPCAAVGDLAELRRRIVVPIAADESIRRAANPEQVRDLGAADVAVLKVAPLGGIDRVLQMADSLGLPSVVSSALDTSIGLAAGVVAAGALSELPMACGLNTASLLAVDVIDEPLVSGPDDDSGALSVNRAVAAMNSELTSHSTRLDPAVVDRWVTRLELMSEVLLSGSVPPSP